MRAPSLTRPLAAVVLVTAVLLAVPLIAMQFTQEVAWSAGDFLAAATLLLSAGAAMVLGVRRAATVRGKAFIVTAVALLFLLVWAHLAVGLFN